MTVHYIPLATLIGLFIGLIFWLCRLANKRWG